MTITVAYNLTVNDGVSDIEFVATETYDASYNPKSDRILIDYAGDGTILVPVSPAILSIFFTV